MSTPDVFHTDALGLLLQAANRIRASNLRVRADSSGVHFFDRRSGLNVLFDEVTVPPVHHARAPRFVSMALTNACDLSCAFCYAPKHPARLSTRDVLRWATELDANGCLGLGFGGGEPTLHPRFALLCEKITAETRLAVSFTTHGHHLSDDLARDLTGVISFLRVSMDGIGDTYSRIRDRPFSAFRKKLDIARSIAPFGINYVVNPDTLPDLEAAISFAVDHGAFEVLLLPQHDIFLRRPRDSHLFDRLVDLVRRNTRCRLALSDTTSLPGVPIADPFRDADSLTAYAHVDASGHLRPSSFSPLSAKLSTTVTNALNHLRTNGAKR